MQLLVLHGHLNFWLCQQKVTCHGQRWLQHQSSQSSELDWSCPPAESTQQQEVSKSYCSTEGKHNYLHLLPKAGFGFYMWRVWTRLWPAFQGSAEWSCSDLWNHFHLKNKDWKRLSVLTASILSGCERRAAPIPPCKRWGNRWMMIREVEVVGWSQAWCPANTISTLTFWEQSGPHHAKTISHKSFMGFWGSLKRSLLRRATTAELFRLEWRLASNP